MAAGDRFFYSSQAYRVGQIAIANPAALYLATGFNPGADCFLLFFDTVLSPLTAGLVPKYSIIWPTETEVSWSPATPGRPFGVAIQWATSSTGDIYTASPVAVWLDIEGRQTT